jgi:diaminohydroxyphosphoribosylaminopyrimidine deaminase/5-amino-6-(5-phosphoribosylamino)uracil reductase
MVGAQTVRDDNPRLTPRDHGDQGRDSVIRVIPTRGQLNLKESLLMDEVGTHPVWVYTTEAGAREDAMKWAAGAGAEIIAVQGTATGEVDMESMLEDLFEREVFSVFCEGGARLASSLLGSSLVNRLHLFRAPKLLGADGGKPGVGDLGIRNIGDALNLQRVDLHSWPPDTEEIFQLSSAKEV